MLSIRTASGGLRGLLMGGRTARQQRARQVIQGLDDGGVEMCRADFLELEQQRIVTAPQRMQVSRQGRLILRSRIAYRYIAQMRQLPAGQCEGALV